MNKHYKLIVGHDFSLSNETDSDIQSDYFPGMWGIKTQKNALKYAKEEIIEGNTVKVDCYKNPKYYALANWFIKELATGQELYKEPETLTQGPVKAGMPSNLSQLKKFLTVGKQIHVKNYFAHEVKERDTSVLSVQSTSFIFEKILGSGIKSWMDIGKASEWLFTDISAQKYFIEDDGSQKLAYEIIY